MYQYLESKSAIEFDVAVDAAPVKDFTVSMTDDEDNAAAVSLKTIFEGKVTDGWSKVSIDLNCFAKGGVDLGKVISPMMFTTDGPADVSFANVKLIPKLAEKATVSCQ